MSKRSKVLVVLPTCRGYTIPMQTIPVDWCIVHDREMWPVEVEDDNDGRIQGLEESRLGSGADAEGRRADEGTEGVDRKGETGENVPSGLGPASSRHGWGDSSAPWIRGRVVANVRCTEGGSYGVRTSAIRQAGLEWGYSEGYDFILTVDDDCILPRTWAESHLLALSGVVPRCTNTVPGQVIRGIPVGDDLPVGISHGLWSGVLDYPAWFQIANDPGHVDIPDTGWRKISPPFPMCGMNVGFRREAIPAVFFQHTFRRHDDIFAGWLAQQVLALHGYGFVNGGAVVLHERKSNAEANLILERPGDAVNKRLLQHVQGFTTTYLDIRGTYQRLVSHVGNLRFEDAAVDRKFQEMAFSMIERAWRNV